MLRRSLSLATVCSLTCVLAAGIAIPEPAPLASVLLLTIGLPRRRI